MSRRGYETMYYSTKELGEHFPSSKPQSDAEDTPQSKWPVRNGHEPRVRADFSNAVARSFTRLNDETWAEWNLGW